MAVAPSGVRAVELGRFWGPSKAGFPGLFWPLGANYFWGWRNATPMVDADYSRNLVHGFNSDLTAAMELSTALPW